MTVAAPFPVVEGTEPFVGGGEAFEESTADQEPAAFTGGQTGKGLAECRRWFGLGVGARRGRGSSEQNDPISRAGDQ